MKCTSNINMAETSLVINELFKMSNNTLVLKTGITLLRNVDLEPGHVYTVKSIMT